MNFDSRVLLPIRPAEIERSVSHFAELRQNHPVLREDGEPIPRWHIFSYREAGTVLSDHRRFSSKGFLFGGLRLTDTLLSMDAREHRRLRPALSRALSAKAVAGLADRIARAAGCLVDRVRPDGEMDIVTDFAEPLAAQTLCEFVGVNYRDWDQIRRWIAVGGAGGTAGAGSVARMRKEAREYFAAAARDRRRAPRSDLISSLAAVYVDGEPLSSDDIAALCYLTLGAGHETTKCLLANFMLTMIENPDDHMRLLAEPALIPTSVEEVLRYLPPVWLLLRRTTEETELAGVCIPPNQVVVAWIPSANRDESIFPAADHFDVGRTPNPHITFGHGIHYCAGAPLARLEACKALPVLLQRIRNLRLRTVPSATIQTGITITIRNLPVSFKPH
jgi:cytochrome P450